MDDELYKNLKLTENVLVELYGELPSATEFGVTYEELKLGEGYEYPTKEVFDATLEEMRNNQRWETIRTERNKKLLETDWTQLNDIILENKNEWLTYRQNLRDIPETVEDPENPVWPEPPQVKIIPSVETVHTQLERDLQTTRTDLEEQKQKVLELERENYEQNKKIELLEMSHAALIQRIEALENM